MKTFLVLAMLLMSVAPLFSENAEKMDVTALQEIKKINQQLLEKQEKTFQAIDEMEKMAEQIRIFSKRN